MTGENEGRVKVSGAEIYWETSGNPAGIPVLYLHGGPGAAPGQGYRTRHDASRFWTVGLHQRGCGRSSPTVQDNLSSLSANTTQTLIEDIEAVRTHLRIGKWIVTGASWGSTLALAYALQHRDRVHGVALMAVTAGSRDEVEWITEGVGRIFPEAWAEFSSQAGCRPGERIVDAYTRRLAGPDRDDAAAAALAWDRWESTHISLDPLWQPGAMFDDDRKRMTCAILVTHYWSHDCFLTGGQAIMERVHQLNGIPGYLIHGRRDVSGPVITPWKLHQRWEDSRLIVVENEGHGGPKSLAALVEAVEEIAAGVSRTD
ncbi:alpha/beta fold hydrolase [Arthrobacter sp. FW305-BF8]|uniref:alpha/beta fold hydrolase n=1 Tax=Arthrobacter sp. FW305-BF8 TaxID=2879617 RepID=UPI001F215379|nr:alpha/beta fold hydrolase [Arthrobacter sp. FW305-BF8]UKA52382.1 alpha/beta fold hydrolase [Arthrobacter sp. FW305-BF8]